MPRRYRTRHPLEAVAQARALFEGSHLSLREIEGRVGIRYWHIFRLSHRLGWVRPAREKRRRRRAGVPLPSFRGDEDRPGPCPAWAAPPIWGRAPSPAAPPARETRGKGRPYPAAVVHEIGELVRGTTLTQREIARRAGVGQATVQRFMARHGWRRPAGAPVATDAVGLARGGRGLRLRDLRLRILALAERAVAEREGPRLPSPENVGCCRHSPLPLRKSATADLPWGGAGGGGLSADGTVTPTDTPPIRPSISFGPPSPRGGRNAVGGANQPSPPQAGGGLAVALALREAVRAACGRRGVPAPALAGRDAPSPLRPADRWSPVLRLSAVAAREGRTGRPYPDAKLAEARHLFETSVLTIHEIAAETGVAPTTLCRWRENGGWVRPRAAPKPADLATSDRAVFWHAARTRPVRLRETAEEAVAALEEALARGETLDLAVLRSALDLAIAASRPLRRTPRL